MYTPSRLDFYAAAALQGILANPKVTEYANDEYVEHAYSLADAMVELLNNPTRKEHAEHVCNHSIKTDDNE